MFTLFIFSDIVFALDKNRVIVVFHMYYVKMKLKHGPLILLLMVPQLVKLAMIVLEIILVFLVLLMSVHLNQAVL